MRNASFKLSLYGSVVSVCCVGFASFDVVCDELHNIHGMLLLSTHYLDPCLWEESDHPAVGPPARLSLHLASSSITPAGSVHKSRGDSVVRMWMQLKRWYVSCVWVLQRGHSGDGCMRSILLFPLVARCLETIDVCIWRMCVLCLL